MNLYITDSEEFNDRKDMYIISPVNFGTPAYHPYLATNKWEVVYVDITDAVPRGYFKQLIKAGSIVVPVFNGPVTMKTVLLLCEIFPDDMAKLRVAFTKGKEEFDKVLNIMKEKYGWSMYELFKMC